MVMTKPNKNINKPTHNNKKQGNLCFFLFIRLWSSEFGVKHMYFFVKDFEVKKNSSIFADAVNRENLKNKIL